MTLRKLKRCKKFDVPSSIGRLPINLSSNYGGFKASQWQTWIIVYSPVVLKDLIPADHLQCWLLFVRACTILSQRILKVSNVYTADLFLVQFCRKFEVLYGSENCTPNLHLHLHLKDCILDYGPGHTFWCFSFERYNGLLGSYHTNRKSIESQIMRNFVHSQKLRSEASLIHPELLSILPCKQPAGPVSLTDIADDENDTLMLLRYSSYHLLHLKTLEWYFCFHLCTRMFLKQMRFNVWRHCTDQLYPQKVLDVVSPLYVCSGRALMCSQVIWSCMNSMSARSSSVVMAFWPQRGNQLSIDYSRTSVGVVQYFFKHVVKFNISAGQQVEVRESEHTFAYIKWKQSHANQDWFGISATVCVDLDEPFSMCSFMAVQRLYSVCASTILNNININGFPESVFVAVPIPIKLCM